MSRDIWPEWARRVPVLGRQIRSFEKARIRWRISLSSDPKAAFTLIHREKYWGASESVSGNGSTLASTEVFRAEFEALLRRLDVTCLFDAPCGDFNWMRLVTLPHGARYIGADIVDDIVAGCNQRHAARDRAFLVIDIADDHHPRADLWLCRDAFLHLSYREIHRSLLRFLESGTRLCLLTTYPEVTVNRDVRTGLTRHVNLEAAPIGLPPALCYLRDDPVGEGSRVLGLWSRDQVEAAVTPARQAR